MNAPTDIANGAASAAPALMLIDDDDRLRETVALVLEEHGYVVDCCADGKQALSRLQTGASPDLILLDVQLPRMDGWQFRIAQKREPRWASIPVVAMSAEASPQAAAIDADAFLTKPVKDDLLIAIVGQLVQAVDRQRLLARTRELDRLAALGQLAGSIAHEVNNPLFSVLGSLELAQRKASELEARLSGEDALAMANLSQVLSRAQRSAERAAAVVRAVSMFATADTEAVLAIDLREVMESALAVASLAIRGCARLERAYESVPSVCGNPAKLGQVFLNLVLHAVHALRAARQGVIRVAIGTGPGRRPVVSISCTGRGLRPARNEHLFDPSLAADPAGASVSAPGLAVSRETIEALGGTIEVETHPGAGITFRVILPSSERPARAPAEARLAVTSERAQRRRPRVLVVDDDQLVCDLLTEQLQVDYDVAGFTCPRAALASMLQGAFDVVLCDLMMPELTGMDIYQRLSAGRPELAQRTVFMTAGAFTEESRRFLAKTRRPQVRKPFRVEQLVDLIEAQLTAKH